MWNDERCDSNGRATKLARKAKEERHPIARPAGNNKKQERLSKKRKRVCVCVCLCVSVCVCVCVCEGTPSLTSLSTRMWVRPRRPRPRYRVFHLFASPSATKTMRRKKMNKRATRNILFLQGLGYRVLPSFYGFNSVYLLSCYFYIYIFYYLIEFLLFYSLRFTLLTSFYFFVLNFADCQAYCIGLGFFQSFSDLIVITSVPGMLTGSFFNLVFMGSIGFRLMWSEFDLTLLGFTEIYGVLPSFTEFHLVWLGYT